MTQHTLGESRHRAASAYVAGTAVGLIGLIAGFVALFLWMASVMLG